MSTTETVQDSTLAKQILERICSDLSMMLDCELPTGAIEVSRPTAVPTCEGSVHIAFKFALCQAQAGTALRGAVLVPLADAMSMAGLQMMEPAESLSGKRQLTAPDEAGKEAMLELSSLITRCVDATLSGSLKPGWNVQTLGCQGVQAGGYPALSHKEGDELIVAEMKTQLPPFDEFKLTLIVPALPGSASE